MVKLSGLVCAHNEEARLTACLERLAFCDEIVVVADRCTDRTEQIARRHGARVVSGIFPVEGRRKEAGVAACRGEWIFELDADEHVPPRLAQEIRLTIAARGAADWYQVPVDNYVGDRLVRDGWGGSFGCSSVARLFRKGVKTWKHERVHPGTSFHGVYGGKLETAIAHKVDDDIADMIQRLSRYTALRAQDLAEGGKIKGIGDDLFRGIRRFFKCYVSRKGYREGEYGVLIALMAALYPILSNLRARELLRAQSKPPARLIAPTARTPVKLHPATGPRSAVAAKLDNGVGLAH
ncbi:glycosyl transferase [Caulobacter sp. CCUG 60055]|uniref:glycosyltransferase family 2 protein n=1 Tax=Caulobacter sp. CCUG 60055 TaxID=2100090 RepID=UPI001FA759A2|nr:glycosyltransferase family 2 protein [Caulobacter sp. CCUG 60055]MBQ1541695.1 glycosyltransferase family 2 protein [Caulobacteraceae bacterium]MCI3181922.1 glycosyl transferase [Caulobacter sp. CCUG 60055]